MKGTEDLEMHDPFQIGAETDGPVGGSAFDSALGGDSFLMSDLTSSDEMTDLLDFELGLPPLHPLMESNDREDNIQGSKTLNRPPSKASMCASDHTLVDVNCRVSSLDFLDILQSPAYPTPQSPKPLFGRKELHQKDVKYASSPGNNTSLRLSETADCSSVCSSTPKSSSFLSCQCMQKVVLLHEEVQTKRNEDRMTSTDYRLSFQKSVLSQCNGILGCKDCRSISAFAVLVITICERLVCSSQSISRSCLDKLRHHQQQRQCPDLRLRKKISSDEEDLGGGSNQKVYIGGYFVESPQQQSFLVIRAIEFQLRELRCLLTDVAVNHGWEKHISMLHPIGEQLQQIRWNLREVPNDALDDAPHGSASLFGRYSLR